MPSPRRIRLLTLGALGTVVLILFYTSGLNSERDADAGSLQDFYHKTMQAMDGGSGGKERPPGQEILDSGIGNKAGHIPADKDADGDVDADDVEVTIQMQERLKAAEQKAKDKANEKAPLKPDPPSHVIGMGSSAEGQKKELKPGAEGDVAAASKEKAPEMQEAEDVVSAILQKAPVVIFSKTYCPFSKRAKGLLLEKYLVTPDPYVVELDEHPLGPYIQDVLEAKTKRRSVPNIMINGVSIGGSDELVQLDNGDKLIQKILSLGNDRVDVSERLVSGKTNV